MKQNSKQSVFLDAFDAYGDAIFRFCIVKTSNKEMAEDLTQETFMRYWQTLREGRDIENPRPFLYRIATNLIIDWYRKKKSGSLDELTDAGFEPVDQKGASAEQDAEYMEVIAAMGDMEEKDREVLLLRYVEGLEPRDIAEILGESTNVVSVRINRAIKKLQEKINI